jgi:hypothetical protein
MARRLETDPLPGGTWLLISAVAMGYGVNVNAHTSDYVLWLVQ